MASWSGCRSRSPTDRSADAPSAIGSDGAFVFLHPWPKHTLLEVREFWSLSRPYRVSPLAAGFVNRC